MFNFEKFNLPANIISEIKSQVSTMLATGTDYPFNEHSFRDFASAIHKMVTLAAQLGKDGVAARSEMLRDELAKRGIQAPEGDFIYFGGRCIPTPTLFLSESSRKEIAEKMADDILSKINTVDKVDDDTVIDILLSSAGMDDEMLYMRTDAIVRKYKEKFPKTHFNVIVGNVTFLPDGRVMSLHYLDDLDSMFAKDDEDDDEYTITI